MGLADPPSGSGGPAPSPPQFPHLGSDRLHRTSSKPPLSQFKPCKELVPCQEKRGHGGFPQSVRAPQRGRRGHGTPPPARLAPTGTPSPQPAPGARGAPGPASRLTSPATRVRAHRRSRAEAPPGSVRPLRIHLSSSPWGTENNGRGRPAHHPAYWLYPKAPGNSAFLLVKTVPSLAAGGRPSP